MNIIKPSVRLKDPIMQKALDDIHRNIELLSNAVNDLSGIQGSAKSSQNFLVEQQSDGSYKIKVRHQNGFVEVDASLSTGV